ncbi:MAG TPA: type II toxin-antitoxin system VapB family antitoxin [Vicinamibacterales bacterium]|nr:type II toxin-antitoxin system VapB family antitoxin [Vicinamibacterales bacterium]
MSPVPLNIKNLKVERLASEVATLTAETMTEAFARGADGQRFVAIVGAIWIRHR